MDKGLTIVTHIPEMYRLYPEFQFCLAMFRAGLPDGAALIEAEGDRVSLRDLVLERRSAGPYLLVVKEPAVMITKGTVEEMCRVLDSNPGLSCVLPSDPSGHRFGRGGVYHTLRGFEKFVRSLYDAASPRARYDGRRVWMFLVRREALADLSIPGDPLEIPGLLPAEEVCVSLNAYVHPFFDYELITRRSDVLPFVPAGILSLLDIGCHTGNFGALVKERFGCRVTGSEINPQAAEAARSRLDAVIGDVLSSDIAEKFDCITCLDVLEHFVEPARFLEKALSLLNDDGHLLLCVPNIGHWSIVEDLLAGRWDYIPAGILCSSHVRFYTKRSIETLLKECGFEMISVQELPGPMPEKTEAAFGKMEGYGFEIDRTSLSSLGYYILARIIR